MTGTPLSRAQLSRFRKYLQRKYRWQERRYLVEGWRACRQTAERAPGLLEAFIAGAGEFRPDWLPAGVPFLTAEAEDLASLCETETPQGAVAVCRMPGQASPASASGPVLALDGLQDPGNLGTLIRTQVWFGGSTLLLGPGTADPYQPKVVRSAAGALASAAVAETDLETGLGPWLAAGYTVFLLDLDEQAVRPDARPLPAKSLFVIGNEGNGIRPALRSAGHAVLSIPGSGRVESLNAGISGSIALYQWFLHNNP